MERKPKRKNFRKEHISRTKRINAVCIENQILPNIEQLEKDLENIKTIKQLLNNSLIYHDSISSSFRSLMFSKYFRWEVTAYKGLENEGVNIISNPNLKESILKIYNMHYPEVERFLSNFSNNLTQYFRPIMRTNFSFKYAENLNTEYIPLDINTLKSNQEFKNAVQTAFINFRYNLKSHKELEKEVLKTIELIDEELKAYN